MSYILSAACGSNMGKIRKNNEDNFYFDGRCLEEINSGLKHPVAMERALDKELCVAIFDGMGGERFGEVASFTAADCMKNMTRRLSDYFISEKKYLNDMCRKLNEAVMDKKQEYCTEHMGTTMVALYFSHGYVYVCNLGDSRAYRLRDSVFQQLSVDHILQDERLGGRKAPLTQHLGIDPEEYLLEPYIAKGELKSGDQYLICSDGLTDMLSNLEIADILNTNEETESCVEKLIEAALVKGGRDNITVILCRVI